MTLRPAAPAELEDALTRAQQAVNDAIRACHDVPGTWRPIETAPRDYATEIDLYLPGIGRVADCIWGHTTYGKKLCFIHWIGDDCNGPIHEEVANASHWMPLPEPPDA